MKQGKTVYSNLIHELELSEEEVRKSGKFHQHAAWNYCGYVFYDPIINLFYEEIWVYNSMVGIKKNASLKTLIEETIEVYGNK